MFRETAPETFAPLPLARAYVAGSPLREAIIHMYVHLYDYRPRLYTEKRMLELVKMK